MSVSGSQHAPPTLIGAQSTCPCPASVPHTQFRVVSKSVWEALGLAMHHTIVVLWSRLCPAGLVSPAKAPAKQDKAADEVDFKSVV